MREEEAPHMELRDWLQVDDLAATTCQFQDRHGHAVTLRRLRMDLFEITVAGEIVGTGSAYGVLRHYDRYSPVFPVLADQAQQRKADGDA